jgi:hypothetical protein
MKLARKLWEQIELAKAQEAGTQFAPSSSVPSPTLRLDCESKWK